MQYHQMVIQIFFLTFWFGIKRILVQFRQDNEIYHKKLQHRAF